ncbi:Maturase K [Frankliniella fusca]|uniref:Maturase K n=1 Tax=Frankliniella fusca TaxID=407009 RepID=A0AAE1GRI4_9NEOP|nr:Maturase K [Frankliniella fusca]
MEVLLRENTELKNKLIDAMTSKGQKEEPEYLSGLLRDLNDLAKVNAGRKEKGWRYTGYDEVKELCVLLYLLGGLQTFELLTANLPIPSVSLVKSVLISHNVAKEGEFRIQELKEFLIKRNLPLEVFISEDATKITGRIMYHPGTNQLVGFVLPRDENGLPIVGSFPATSARVMCKYFKEEITSNFAYVLMAQPLGTKAAPFCLCLFGTNNSFKATDVLNMWNWLLAATAKEGIKIRGFASDGDSKLLHAMRYRTFTSNPKSNWKWFEGDKLVENIVMQDFVHILVKLKTRLLKPSCILPVGPKYVASSGHILELKNNFPKELHDLSDKIFHSKDKMNFESAAKLCSKSVSDLLTEENISCSSGTKLYVDMMRETFNACASPSLTPLERIELLWKWVIFLRIWRKWILDCDGYTLQHNFITANAYYCIELNAHAVIQSVILNREHETPQLFRPWLYSSQPCESLFRMFRGMSTTFNTVVNFSMLDMIYRLRRIDFMAEAYVNLKEKYSFPRQLRAFQAIEGQEYICATLPEDIDIEHAVHRAFQKANEYAVNMKLIKHPLRQIPPSTMAQVVHESSLESEEIDDEEIDNDVAETNEDIGEALESDSEEENEINEDLAISSSATGIRMYDNIEVTPTSPFVRVKLDNGDKTVIRKSTYCWRLSCGDTKLSSDRVVKFKSKAVQHRSKSTNNINSTPSVEAVVSIGEWCAFVSEDKSIILGRIIAFSFMSGTSWSNQAYQGNTAKIKHEGREVGCMCSWFSTSCSNRNQTVLNEVTMDLQGFYSLRHYICTIPRPLFENGKLHVSPSIVPKIKVIAKGRAK